MVTWPSYVQSEFLDIDAETVWPSAGDGTFGMDAELIVLVTRWGRHRLP